MLNAITDDDRLLDELVAEPSVTNVFSGHVPTHLMAPHVPHDGYLGEFLMRNKGFVRR